MKVLFIGGTGTISTAVSELLVKKGVDLYLFNRGNRKDFIPEGAKVLIGDINNENDVKKVLDNHSFDVIVDWIAFVPQDVERDIRMFTGKTRQYIFISSASAYQKPLGNHIITESTPLCNPYWQYSRDKIACEDLLLKAFREEAFPITIVRPSHTYGKTRLPYAVNSSRKPWTLIDRLIKGKKIIVPGDGTSFWTLTHNTDFAVGFAGLLGNINTLGHAFHITSDELLTWEQVLNIYADAFNVKPNIVHISSEFITAFIPEMEAELIGDKTGNPVFDNSKIKRFVPEYNAVVPFGRGIQDSIKWFEAHPELCTIDEEFNKTVDRIIEAYEHGLSYAKK